MKISVKKWNGTIWTAALSALVFSACTDVSFENPVPHSGAPLRSFPTEWEGTYVVESWKKDMEAEEPLQTCFHLERAGDDQLMVGTEYRLAVRDLPQLKAALEAKKQAGELGDYQLTESFIFYTTNIESEGRRRQESHFVTLLKKGDWLVLTQSIAPFWLLDLSKGRRTDFDVQRRTGSSSSLFPTVDSVSVDYLSLVARSDREGWYFNTRKEGEWTWALLYLSQPAKDRLLIKISNLNDQEAFAQRLDYYNSITPFQKEDEHNYRIAPTDEALHRLLRDEGLFETIRLRKIEE